MSRTKLQEVPNENWRNIQRCLAIGRRGLPGGDTIHNLLYRAGRLSKVRALPFDKKKQVNICKSYQSGISSTKLAAKYNTNKSTILRLLKRNGIVRRDRSLTSGEKNTILRLIKQRLTLLDIASKIGRDVSAVGDFTRSKGIMPIGKKVLNNKQELEIIEKNKSGRSQTSLSEEYKCSTTVIRSAIIRHGVVPNTKTIRRPRKRRKHYSEGRICSEYQSGYSSLEVAAHHHIHSTTVLKVLRKHNVCIRPALKQSH